MKDDLKAIYHSLGFDSTGSGTDKRKTRGKAREPGIEIVLQLGGNLSGCR